ncbi:MAG: type II toxin-antitoxin system HicA family toxin [candidate division WOR-3 bacterium]
MKKLRAFGFDGSYKGGRHYFMVKGNLRLTIPNPHSEDIGIPLLKEILAQAGINRDEWLSA